MNVRFNTYNLVMKIFLKILILSTILIGWLYFFTPKLFKGYENFSSKKIDIQKYTLTPNVWKIYLLNLKLLSSKDFEFNSTQWGVELYFNAIDAFNTNIINLLDDDNATKKIVLNTYIKQLEKIQSELSDTINNINNTYTEEQTKTQEYLQQKEYWDSNFNNGFNTKDSKLVINWLNQSFINGPKYMEHRILSNAGKILWYKLENIKSLIDTKLILLQNNSDMIIEHYDIIKWNLLWKLMELKQRLELNKYN